MTTTADALLTDYELIDNYTPKANRIVAATQRIGVAQNATKATTQDFQASIASSAVTVEEFANPVGIVVGALTLLAAGFLSVVAASAALARETVPLAADYDALTKSLEKVEGSASRAAIELQHLRDIAKAPGLGFMESIKGFTGLRMAGLDDNLSEEVVKQFGNANALAGGGKEEFGRVLMAVRQMANKPFLQGDELMQLNEANIPAQSILKQAFGTADTEELKKRGIDSIQVIRAMVLVLGEMARAGDSSKNTWDNLTESVLMGKIQMGQGIAEGVDPMAQALGKLIDTASAGNVFKDLGRDIAAIFEVDTATLEDAFVNVIAGAKTAFQFVSELLGPLKALFALLGVASGPLDFFGGAIGDSFNKNKKEVLAGMARGRAEEKRKADKDAAEKGGLGQVKDDFLKGGNHSKGLADIAQYTKQTADNTNPLKGMQDSILGGGSYGRGAFSAVNETKWGGAHASGHSEIHRNVLALVGSIEKAIQMSQMVQARRGR